MSLWLNSTTHVDSGSSGHVLGLVGPTSWRNGGWLNLSSRALRCWWRLGKYLPQNCRVEHGCGSNPEGKECSLAWPGDGYQLGICKESQFWAQHFPNYCPVQQSPSTLNFPTLNPQRHTRPLKSGEEALEGDLWWSDYMGEGVRPRAPETILYCHRNKGLWW